MGILAVASVVALGLYTKSKIQLKPSDPLGSVIVTNLTDTINTFRTNVNTSLTNLNTDLAAATATISGLSSNVSTTNFSASGYIQGGTVNVSTVSSTNHLVSGYLKVTGSLLDANNNKYSTSTGGSGTPTGSSTQIQYNDGGFGSTSTLTFTSSTQQLMLGQGSSSLVVANSIPDVLIVAGGGGGCAADATQGGAGGNLNAGAGTNGSGGNGGRGGSQSSGGAAGTGGATGSGNPTAGTGGTGGNAGNGSGGTPRGGGGGGAGYYGGGGGQGSTSAGAGAGGGGSSFLNYSLTVTSTASGVNTNTYGTVKITYSVSTVIISSSTAVNSFVVPGGTTGTIKLEVWGGQGGSGSTCTQVGLGASASGTIPAVVGSTYYYSAPNTGGTGGTGSTGTGGAGGAFAWIGTTNTFAPASQTDFRSRGNFALASGGHILTGGATPSVGTCGTGPSIEGNDTAFKATLGTGNPTACTVTFALPYIDNTPICTFNDDSSTVNPDVSAISTSSVTITLSGALSSGNIYGICLGK